MTANPEQFAQHLTAALYRIRTRNDGATRKTLAILQDEIGYALGRDGGSSVEYWRKGHIPRKVEDVAQLASELCARGGFDQAGLTAFLNSAGYPAVTALVAELFPQTSIASLSPFVIGPPISHPRQFFGRSRELRRIFNLWSRFPLQNVAIIGPRRSGKTSLCRHLMEITTTDPSQLRDNQRSDWLPQPAQYQWVFVDFQNPRLCQQEGLLRYILESLEMSVPSPCDINNFFDVLGQNLRRPTLILLDEIGAGLAAPDLDQQFWWSLRSLGSNFTNGLLGFALTAHDVPAVLAEAEGKPSPFFNIFGHVFKLGPFTDEEAHEFLALAPRPIPPESVEWMMTHSQGWPALLQIAAESYTTALAEGAAGAEWKTEARQRMTLYGHLRDEVA